MRIFSRFYKLFFILTACMVLSVSCSSNPPASDKLAPEATSVVDSPTTSQLPEGQAIVDSIEVQQLADSLKVQVVVQGHLTDNCTAVESAEAHQVNSVIQVFVDTKAIPDSQCSPVKVPFEKVIPVDVTEVPGGEYVVTEGVVANFSMVAAKTTSNSEGENPVKVMGEAPADVAAPTTGDLTSDGTKVVVQTEPPAANPAAGTGTTETAGDNSAPAVAAETTGDTSTPPIKAETTGDTITGESVSASSTETTGTNQQDLCTDQASFVKDVTYPDNTPVETSQVFTKTWRVRNEGTCTWGAGYSLEFTSGNTLQGTSTGEFPSTAPGANADLSLQMTAPDALGSFSGSWRILNPNNEAVTLKDNQGVFDLWAVILIDNRNKYVSKEKVEVGTDPGDATVSDEGTTCAQRNTEYENKILNFVNQARAANGLNPLTKNGKLTAAALVHSTDMSCNDYLGHVGTDGSDWFARIRAQGYNYDVGLENIYYGYGGLPDNAFNWWMNSTVHRENILNSKAKEAGVAYVLNLQTGAGYYTMVFGSQE